MPEKNADNSDPAAHAANSQGAGCGCSHGAAAISALPIDKRHPSVCAPVECDGHHDPASSGAVQHGNHTDDHVGHAHHYRHGDHCDLHGCC